MMYAHSSRFNVDALVTQESQGNSQRYATAGLPFGLHWVYMSLRADVQMAFRRVLYSLIMGCTHRHESFVFS